MDHIGPFTSNYGLENNGLNGAKVVHWNQTPPQLYEAGLRRGEGVLSVDGAFVTKTGEYTGRSPKDKFMIEDTSIQNEVWWGPVNQPLGSDKFEIVHLRMMDYFRNREVFVQDCYCGADPTYRLPVRIVTENAWHSLFARNMFLQPKDSELSSFVPEWTVIQAPDFHSIPEQDGTNSEVCILVNIPRKTVLVGGSHYTGEIKKSIFGVMNWILPALGVMTMHCSANIGKGGDTAIFFGLSGTGKTTLSSDSSRTMIGDDEHGWSDNGVFNFEGGCYAKTINLSQEAEPEIYAASRRFGTVLENVVLDPVTRIPDFYDGSLAENARSSYPLDYLDNIDQSGMGGHPENIIMLTADAFGVLPPISKMTPEQAMYHFLSGYTAKVAGTERGMTSGAEATFSTCFGAPFLPRHPTVYAKLLGERIAKHKSNCWLVNTGWSGGGYGVGERMKIAHTKAMVRAALDGKLDSVGLQEDPNFGLLVPEGCPEVPSDVLTPRNTWSDKGGYDSTAQHLAKQFENNFKQFEEHVDDDVNKAAIHTAA
ncbi:MAG: phosphoenolpyruvate carboxykinase [Rhodospirillaceae bacterium]